MTSYICFLVRLSSKVIALYKELSKPCSQLWILSISRWGLLECQMQRNSTELLYLESMYSSTDIFPIPICFLLLFYCFKLLNKASKQANKQTNRKPLTKKPPNKKKQPSPSKKIPKHIFNWIFKSRRWKPNYLTTSPSIQCISLQQKRENVLHENNYPFLLTPCVTTCVLLCHSCHQLLIHCGTGRGDQVPKLLMSIFPPCFCLFT